MCHPFGNDGSGVGRAGVVDESKQDSFCQVRRHTPFFLFTTDMGKFQRSISVEPSSQKTAANRIFYATRVDPVNLVGNSN